MARKTNSLERFWKELKRRKTIRVITVYAAAAFIVLQLVDIISKPLQLPEWTLTFMIVLLCVGFIIAAFLSWIYDITPTGVKKTKSVSHSQTNMTVKPEASNTWKIVSYISIAFILVLLAFNILSRKKSEDLTKLDKSIAVLPFINDSPNDSNKYFINGIMDEVLANLQKIKNFSVVSRNSVEQYRNLSKSTPEIARELNVNYIVEGSGQKYGNSYRLRVQLIAANQERHLWAESYEQEIKDTKDIYGIQSQIAQAIASSLKAIITPEEKQLIEKTPTTSLTAYDFYQRGKDEYNKYWTNGNVASLQKAEDFYHKSLEYDSTFALAYVGLALVYNDKYGNNKDAYFAESYLDSTLILANKALSYDNHLAEAYGVRGNYYYYSKGSTEATLIEYDKALKYNPNYWEAYSNKGLVYSLDFNNLDLVKAIENYHKAVSINHGKELSSLLQQLGGAYSSAGFQEKAVYYIQEAFKLDGDSATYYSNLAGTLWEQGNFKSAVEFINKSYALAPYNVEILGYYNIFIGQFKESLKYYMKYVEWLDASKQISINQMHRIGYVYWMNGDKEKALYYFNEQKRICEESIETKLQYGKSFGAYFDLAGVYAFIGEKGKAYKNLKIWDRIPVCPLYMVTLVKNDPLFNSIRNEPEFQQIVKDVEAKYQEEHERVRKWLEEQGML
jgi:TolB-like protein/Tfp pilus assembly protein PilF